MDEIQIARAKAKILDKLTNSSKYPPNPTGRVTARLGGKEVDWDGVNGVMAELALSRARATNRDYSTVLAETEMAVRHEFAGFLDPTYDMVLKGEGKAVEVAVEEEEGGEEGGGVCGICQEEMEVDHQRVSAMGCMHKFHVCCIFRWLKVKRVCPLCRYSVVVNDH